MHRRSFIQRIVGLGATTAMARAAAAKRIKVGVVGCGSVSQKYFPHLAKCPYATIVSACDRVPERAREAASRHNVPNHYASLAEMLSGAPFELLVNLTDIQNHYAVNKQGLDAGKNVWSEKTAAPTHEQGKELLEMARARGLRMWGAPTAVLSPQFQFMARAIAAGKLGRIAAAHASYGHLGPNWAAFFYAEGGGSMPDLMVYDLTVLTGLLGPAREVIAAGTIVTPSRDILRDEKVVNVEAEDNAMVTIYHDQEALSHAQSGFNYFDAFPHTYTGAEHQTIDIFGREGEMHLVGYCWAPLGVDLATKSDKKMTRYADEPSDYVWQNGASHMAECMVKGIDSPMTPEHALHVVEIVQAANESQHTGRRIKINSTFKWPIYT